MRQAGSIAAANEAQRFAAHLITCGITAQIEQDEPNGVWAIWIRDEDHLSQAKEELKQFLANPNHERYAGAEQAAAQKLREQLLQRERASGNVRDMREQWSNQPPTSGLLTRAVILICGVVFVLTDWGQDQQTSVYQTLAFVDASRESLIKHANEIAANRNADGELVVPPLLNIRHGELWRIITPIFLHLSIVHLLFNMLMYYQLASLIEFRRGTWRLALLMLVTAVTSNLVQALLPMSWGGSPHFGGMSGVIYGLLGYAWIKSSFEPMLGIRIRSEVVAILVILMFIFWLAGAGPDGKRTANWAHLIGFVSGSVSGFATYWLRKTKG